LFDIFLVLVILTHCGRLFFLVHRFFVAEF
jgi:hypothetical protein